MNSFADMADMDRRHQESVGYRRDAGGPSAEGQASRFYSAADLEGRPVPQRQWLVHNMVPMKTVTLFGGDGGTGKSLLALQLAVSAATGRAWINEGVPKGRALFLSAEDDDDELHMRLADICRAMGLRLADLGSLTLRSLAGENALLAMEASNLDARLGLVKSALFDEIEARAAEEQPSLIVLDTLADMFPANENDRAAVRQFIGILRGLALRQKCAVILLSHPSLTGLTSGTGTSGSTAWNNSVRSRLYLERIVQDGYEADPDKRILSTKKANYGRVGAELSVTWQAGVFVRDAEPQGLDALAAGAKAERVFLSLLAEFTEQGRYVSATPSVTYAPALFAKHPKSEGCTKRSLASAMEALLSRGTIVIGQHGTGSKARSHIEKAGCNPPGNAECNEGATPRATPRQPPANGGATLSPNTPGVAPALGGGVHADPEAYESEMW
ncbi:AAA family ATPase [Paracoccus panacisoli]|uniref:AAA family ATPase n=1 Tax=Paracoccus panacisoli TaxID=1510163 RepID=A0ABV6T5N8_9RHOB